MVMIVHMLVSDICVEWDDDQWKAVNTPPPLPPPKKKNAKMIAKEEQKNLVPHILCQWCRP